MLRRRLSTRLNHLLRYSPAVVLLGPRQAGKTTLALEIGEQQASVYLDLEDGDERAKLSNPTRYLADHENITDSIGVVALAKSLKSVN
jgi:predicted AAA+ superfamily ATPase